MTPSPGTVIPSRALMFQCSFSALMLVPFLMAIPSPLRDLRTWLRIGAAWLNSHYRSTAARATTHIPDRYKGGMLVDVCFLPVIRLGEVGMG